MNRIDYSEKYVDGAFEYRYANKKAEVKCDLCSALQVDIYTVVPVTLLALNNSTLRQSSASFSAPPAVVIGTTTTTPLDIHDVSVKICVCIQKSSVAAFIIRPASRPHTRVLFAR